MIILFIAVTIGVIFYAYKKQKREEAARDAAFRSTMLALEEKAKKEGTFHVSYFDDHSGTH